MLWGENMKKQLFIVLAALAAIAAAYAYMHIEMVGENTYGVETDAGVRNIAVGAMIGGQYSNHVTLTQEKTILTAGSGYVLFDAGTEINCEHEPGEPDPCNLT